MADPRSNFERPSAQEVLHQINIPIGASMKMIKRTSRTDLVTAKSVVAEGVLTSPLQVGQSILKLGTIMDALKSDGRIFIKTDTGIYELLQNLHPEFGDFGVKVGNLEEAGFVAFNSNHSSNQDAFAINDMRTMFAVSDGIGSRAESGAVSRWLTKKIVEELQDLDGLRPDWLTQKLKELLLDKNFIQKYRKTGVNVSEGGSATLTIAQKESNGEILLLILGDSPAYVVDANGAIVQSYGADSAGDLEVPGDVGYDAAGKISVKGAPIKKRIKLNPGERMVIGSDYLSDGLLTYGKKMANDIARRELFKREGGFYTIGRKFFAVSEISEAQKRSGDFVAWNPGIEATLQNMKAGLRAYETAMKAPQAYRARVKDSPDALKQFEEWQKVGSRSLRDFFDMKTGEEFYRKVSGTDSWKKDDATVVIFQ